MMSVRIAMLGFLAVITALAMPAAWGQTAPAGNAHPDTALVPEGESPNPFGNGMAPSGFSVEQKIEFAREVDLSPLRDLAVFNAGRVKILDTLARETVETLTGRKNYFDVRQQDGERAKKAAYDPLFTYLDLLIDPTYYFDKPLVHIEYLPLRRAMAERATQDPERREALMRMTRLSPMTISQTFAAVAEEHATDLPFSESLQRVRRLLGIFEHGHTALLLVAPDADHVEWQPISALPADDPARMAFRAMGEAWRSGDAAGVNAAAAEIASILPSINAEQYPDTQRRLEAVYNASKPFEYGYWLYAVSLLSLVLAFGTGRKWLVALGLTTLVVAITLHAFGFAARWAIAERLPIQNQFESMTGLALGGAIVGMLLMIARRQWLFGAAAAGVGFLVLLAATQTAIPGASIGREAAILNTSYLLKYHVTTVLVSYGLITLGFIVSLFYLGTHYAARRRDPEAAAFAAEGLGLDSAKVNAGPQRVLSDLDTAQMTVLQLAFWTLGVGILLGAWWADHSWGRWWAFDPKETWALLTWIIYLIIIHVRFTTKRNRALVTAWLSVLGFIVMLWTYFGVNLILPGLHAYA